jgi:hypothetical protein
MTDHASAPRSRRALLVAAAGGAAALAATAALPLTAVAHDAEDVLLGGPNATTTATSISNGTADLTAFAGNATGLGNGLEGTSTGGVGVYGWSISSNPFWNPANGAYTGVYGWSPASPDPGIAGVGVWGDSDEWGVYGSGGVGVYGQGGIGVVGESQSTSAGVLAIGKTAADLALDVRGKVKFSRSGRASFAARQSTKVVTLAGVTAGSHVFAMIQYNRTGRWVRAVVPTTGKFTIYLNTTVLSTTSVAWFVLN